MKKWFIAFTILGGVMIAVLLSLLVLAVLNIQEAHKAELIVQTCGPLAWIIIVYLFLSGIMALIGGIDD